MLTTTKTTSQLLKEHKDILDTTSGGQLKPLVNSQKRSSLAIVTENTNNWCLQQKNAIPEDFRWLTEAPKQDANNQLNEAPTNATGTHSAVPTPPMGAIVRRVIQGTYADNIVGTQALKGPTADIYYQKANYTTQGGTEALFDEANTGFSGTITGTQTPDPTGLAGITDTDSDGTITDETIAQIFGTGLTTAAGENLGESSTPFKEMGFTLGRINVTAKSRGLKGEYSNEVAEDIRAAHGGEEVRTMLIDMLTREITHEIDREIIRTVFSRAKIGAGTANATVKGILNLDTDVDGRWSAEKAVGLSTQIGIEANEIGKETRRYNRGNFAVVSPNVATFLKVSGLLDGSDDFIHDNFAGTLIGNIKVWIDPYATGDFVVVGYKGADEMDAGFFYCPYIPLTMYSTKNESTMNPIIAFKTRYGLVANPLLTNTTNSIGDAHTNPYYRKFRVDAMLD